LSRFNDRDFFYPFFTVSLISTTIYNLHKMNKLSNLIFAVLIMAAVPSCFNSDNGKSAMLPNVMGSTGELIVVIDNLKWDGKVGDKIREVFVSPVEGLPQAEPIFDLVIVTPGKFGEYYITHRNVIMVHTGADREQKVVFQTNKYSSTQLIITLEGKNDDEIIELLEKQKKAIVEKINITERDRWISYYRHSINSMNFNILREKHKITLHVPSNYAMDVNEKGFVWFAYETPVTTQAVLIHYFDYNGENYFSEDSIRSIRNNMTREKVKGPADGTWMKIEDQLPVEYSTFRFRERNWAMLRGLWTLENGFMGGPFVTLVTRDEVNNRFVMLDGFVYAPNDEKRELLRQVEAILYTVSFDIDPEEKASK